MNILVINDDGMDAPGIGALTLALSQAADVYVCAPDTQQSARSHGITIRGTVTVTPHSLPGAKRAWRVTGTPADCTKLGLELCADFGISVDMVYSGINMGSNLGADTLYSGTVGAAMEAAIDGIPAVSVSVDSHQATIFESACHLAVSVMDLARELPAGTILNVNAPHCPLAEMRGVRVTTLGGRYYDDLFTPDGNGVYTLNGKVPPDSTYHPDWDITAIQEGYGSLTPMAADRTAVGSMDLVQQWTNKRDL